MQSETIHFKPEELSLQKLHQTLLGTVGPRPIALASTVDSKGVPNLSPFSFFNAFGVNPTTLIFSPSRRGRDNTTKHTYENIREVPEVVINTVSYGMVQQISLASSEYSKGVNEFKKSGLTPLPSVTIAPFRVKESPVQFECKVHDIIETGDKGGAGNLVICRISMIHAKKDIYDADGEIDPHKMDLVGRLGRDFYCRASGDAVFEVEKPLKKTGIGVDALPSSVRDSRYLTGNDLGKLGNIENLPEDKEIESACKDSQVIRILESVSEHGERIARIHEYAHDLLEKGKNREALRILLCAEKHQRF